MISKMRIDTPAFEGFVKMLEQVSDLTITPDYYEINQYGFIKWYCPSIREQEEVYSRAWNDAAKLYNSLK